MELKHSALAGTLESSDVQVSIEPSDKLEVKIKSSVMSQFGRQIEETVYDVLNNLGVKKAKLILEDKGALDCTIRARVETAIFRAIDQSENLPWGSKL